MPLSNVERLLLAACRGHVLPGTTGDWLAVLDLARIHEVTPLVYSALRSLPVDPRSAEVPLPASVWTDLEQEYLSGLIQHGLAGHELIAVVAALGECSTLALKGPALAAYLYPGTYRLYSDIDVAVREKDYPAARAALALMGYETMTPYDEAFQRAIGKDLALIRRDAQGITWSVELHWSLAEPTTIRLDEDGVWDRAREVMVDGRGIRTPGPEDTLVLLVLNLRKHRFMRLKTLCDIDHLLRLDGHRLDWSVVRAQADAADARAALSHSLHLAHTLLDSPAHPSSSDGGAVPTDIRPGVRKTGLRAWLFWRFIGANVMLYQGRGSGEHDARPVEAVLGLVPFLALDSPQTAFRLIYRRLALSPEYASYRLGLRGHYSSRRNYLLAVLAQTIRAARALPKIAMAKTR